MIGYSPVARHAAWTWCAAFLVAGTIGRNASAQGKGKKQDTTPATCQIGGLDGADFVSAQLYLQKATDPKTDSADKMKALQQAIGTLTPPSGTRNQLGQAYMLGQALALWGGRPGAALSGPRGAIGFKDKPDQPIDVLTFTDSLFKRVEQEKPDCAAYLAQLRQQPYVPLVNAAIEELNAGKVDSAQTLAKEALEIYRQSPYAYNVLGGVAVRHNDFATASTNYLQVIALAGSDTAYARLKSNASYNLAVVTQAQAEAAKGADRRALQDSSVALWRAYAATNPADPNGKAGLAHALQTSGDTLSATALTTDMVANPSKYSDLAILQAARTATQHQRPQDAMKLYEAFLTLNPYFPQALYQVGVLYFNAKDYEKLFPVARRLIDIDPSNPDDFRLLAAGYQLRAFVDKTKRPSALKADNDSALMYFSEFKTLPVQLAVTKFVHDGDKVTLTGTVQNRGTAAKTYTIKFQFLDKTGQVVASQDAPPLTVDPQGTQSFTVSAEQPGIVAYKYAPLQ